MGGKLGVGGAIRWQKQAAELMCFALNLDSGIRLLFGGSCQVAEPSPSCTATELTGHCIFPPLLSHAPVFLWLTRHK